MVRMTGRGTLVRVGLLLTAWVWGTVPAGAQPAASGPEAMLRENTTVRVSEHVYVLPDHDVRLVPNVGIVVGSRATLVVDTGLGAANAEIVLREVAKVSRGGALYVVSTHYHPEHAIGEMAFPDTATIVRARAQQRDIDELGADMLARFRGFTPRVSELLRGARYRPADVLFDREHELDLGGVRVRLLALGPTHTRGDTMAFVEGDGVLLAGDVVMNHRFVSFSAESSVDAWLRVLEAVAPLRPVQVVPSHGAMGDGSLIGGQRAYLEALRTRVRADKAAGRTADDAADRADAALRERFPDWGRPYGISDAARVAYGEAP